MLPKAIKIAAIEPSGRLYGSEYCLLDLLRGVNSASFRWSTYTTQGAFAELLTREAKHSQVIDCLTDNLHLKNKWTKLKTYLRLFVNLAKQKPDVLYVNQAGILRASHFIAEILRINTICQVQTLEDAEALSKTGVSYKKVYAFICNSQFIADRTLVSHERKCVLYQGISPTQRVPITSPEDRKPEDKLRLGILGRISASKGHYLLAEMARHLLNRHCDFSIRVIGDGLTTRDTDQWKEYIQASGMQSFFEFRGYRTNLQEEFGALDLLLIPSLAEPLGRVLFDAANHGVPVVVSDAGGLGEIASLYQVGIPFRSGDPMAMADAIMKFNANRANETSRFHDNSRSMLSALSMTSYLRCIEQILYSTYHQQPSNLTWFGDRTGTAR